MRKYNYNFVNLKNLKGKNVTDVVEYLKYNGATSFDVNDAEGLLSLLDFIQEPNMDGFVISYMIDRICKEFDILKLGNNTIVNIEIKLSNRKDKINQVRQNYFLLANQYSDYHIHIYSYIKTGNKFFQYNPSSDELVESSSCWLNEDLKLITNLEMPNMNIDIKSVYKYPDFFLEDRYILSNAQEIIKDKVLKKNSGIFVISGSGGTGKSLLALDMYKTLSNKKSIIFLTPFAKEKIISKKLLDKFNIRMAKYFPLNDEIFDVVIVDEAQRIGSDHLNKIKSKSKYLILFCDKEQDVDGINQIDVFLDEHKDELEKTSIRQVIRNDSTIDRYARKICGLRKSTLEDKNFDRSKIEIYMYNEFKSKVTKVNNYKLIEPTKSKPFVASCRKYCTSQKCLNLEQIIDQDIVHFEIGKEYDTVIVYLCNGYCINNNRIDKKLPVCYGNLQNQLYTIISRTINKVIFVCDDIEVYNFLSKCKDDLDK